MTHHIKEIPPFEYDGEEVANDSAFADECAEEIRVILKEHKDIEVLEPHISRHPSFGLVYRADFKTAHDEEDFVNRIMFWKLADGELASFFGLNIPAVPLK